MHHTTASAQPCRLSRRQALGGMLAAGAVLGLPAPRAAAAEDGIAAVLRSRINAERTQRGLPALPEDPQLSVVSTAWSQRMAADGGLSHNPDRDAQYGWPVQRSGEVVAYAANSSLTAGQLADRIVTNWMNSSGHRAIILGSGWTDIGIGWSMTSSGRLYATANVITTDLPAAGAEALALSAQVLPGASAPRIVITRGDVPVDALAGSALLDGSSPLLFARPDQPLPGPVLAEISRVATPQTSVYLVGGALHPSLDQQIRGTGANPVRIAGGSRYDTAAMVAGEVAAVRRAPLRFHIIRADAWADAVAVAGQSAVHAYPVLLVDADGVPAATRAVLDAHPGTDRLVIGGHGAVSDRVVQQVQGRRLSGTDRADTGAEVMRQLWERDRAAAGQHLLVTPGWTVDGWATALAHTTWAARHHAPLLFAADRAPEPVRQALQRTGYSSSTAPVLRFARNVVPPAQQDFRALTGN